MFGFAGAAKVDQMRDLLHCGRECSVSPATSFLTERSYLRRHKVFYIPHLDKA
jgi:hypothetical protein